MTARMNGPFTFNVESNYGGEAAQALWEQNLELLTKCRDLVDQYAAKADTGSLILLDACWLGLAQRCRDHLGRHGVEVKALPVPVAAEMCNIIK